MVQTILKVVLAIIAAVMIFLIELQSGKADGLSASITGSNKELNLFSNSKAKGSDLVLERSTTVLVIAFFAIVLVLANIK